MRSAALGNDTSVCEVTHISSHGIWLFAQGEEFFLSYEDPWFKDQPVKVILNVEQPAQDHFYWPKTFPWFKDQPVKVILNVEQPAQDHFYWPKIDVDLSREIINNPDRFPLTAKVT